MSSKTFIARLYLIALLATLAFTHESDAQSQDVHRCVAADGRSIYTDRECADIAAVERNAPPPVTGNVAILHTRDCARSPDDLLFGVRSALDAQDVNKLAAFYLWAGIDSSQSVSLMDRLDVLSHRPLLDLTLEGGDPLATAMVDGEEVPKPIPPNRLVLLQTRTQDSIEAVSSSFQIRRSYGCFWLQF